MRNVTATAIEPHLKSQLALWRTLHGAQQCVAVEREKNSELPRCNLLERDLVRRAPCERGYVDTRQVGRPLNHLLDMGLDTAMHSARDALIHLEFLGG